MWAYDNYATDGLKELAEWGNTYQMEQELKSHVSVHWSFSSVVLLLTPIPLILKSASD